MIIVQRAGIVGEMQGLIGRYVNLAWLISDTLDAHTSKKYFLTKEVLTDKKMPSIIISNTYLSISICYKKTCYFNMLYCYLWT